MTSITSSLGFRPKILPRVPGIDTELRTVRLPVSLRVLVFAAGMILSQGDFSLDQARPTSKLHEGLRHKTFETHGNDEEHLQPTTMPHSFCTRFVRKCSYQEALLLMAVMFGQRYNSQPTHFGTSGIESRRRLLLLGLVEAEHQYRSPSQGALRQACLQQESLERRQ